MSYQGYLFHQSERQGSVPIKHWTRGVAFGDTAKEQLERISELPFIFKHLAVMPDVHIGKGATVGSVIPTRGAIIPAALGVDIGCGMMAVRTTLKASDLPENLKAIRSDIERAVPHGSVSVSGRAHKGDFEVAPQSVVTRWQGSLYERYALLVQKHPKIAKRRVLEQLGTMGGGNHFIEVCLDEDNHVWVMLHSGSRGVGSMIGEYFISLAKREMERHFIHLPDTDLAYLVEGSQHFDEYVEAVSWAQDYARHNREAMMDLVMRVLRRHLKPFRFLDKAVNCHHNYAEKENHFGANVWVTRKGAVRARKGDLGIIPGSMGTGSFIVRGLGNQESFCSCSHGAGRVMSRAKAKSLITLKQHKQSMAGIEGRLDADVLDESPAAYKDVNAVMAAQSDLVEIVHRLRQVINIKG